MFTKLVSLTLALLISSAVAQNSKTNTAAPPSASLPSGNPCVLKCIASSAQKHNCVQADLSCACTTVSFQLDTTQCITKQCTTDDLADYLGAQGDYCLSIATGMFGTPTLPGSGPTPAAAGSSSISPTVTSAPATNTTAQPPTPSTNTKPNAARGMSEHIGLTDVVLIGLIGSALYL